MLWPSIVVPTTVLATAKVGRVSLAWGRSSDELYAEKRTVKVASESWSKTVGGRKMPTTSDDSGAELVAMKEPAERIVFQRLSF